MEDIYLINSLDYEDICHDLIEVEQHAGIRIPELNEGEASIVYGNDGYVCEIKRSSYDTDILNFVVKHSSEELIKLLALYPKGQPVFLARNTEQDLSQFIDIQNGNEIIHSLREWVFISLPTEDLQIHRSNSWIEIETDPDQAIKHFEDFIENAKIGESIFCQPEDPSSSWYIRIK